MAKVANFWGEFAYHFDEILNSIQLRALLASLPVAYSVYFLGSWHLLEVWFIVACVDLLLGIRLACVLNTFSWQRINSWSFKLLIHSLTILAVGALAHVASVALKYDILILNIYVVILIGKELASVVKNMKALKWPVPTAFVLIVTVFDQNMEKKVQDVLEQALVTKTVKEKEESDDIHIEQ